MSHFLVERALPRGMSAVDLDNQTKRLLQVLEDASQVRWVRRYLAHDRSRLIDEFDAPEEAGCVRLLERSALTYERIIEVVPITPEMYLDDPSPEADSALSHTWF